MLLLLSPLFGQVEASALCLCSSFYKFSRYSVDNISKQVCRIEPPVRLPTMHLMGGFHDESLHCALFHQGCILVKSAWGGMVSGSPTPGGTPAPY